MGKLLEVKGLQTQFKVDKTVIINAVDRVSFNIDQGETLAIVGESGQRQERHRAVDHAARAQPARTHRGGTDLLRGRGFAQKVAQ